MDNAAFEWSDDPADEVVEQGAVYRYDAPFHSEGGESTPAESLEEEAIEPAFEDDDAGDDDDDDLFAALDAALDKLEAEERLADAQELYRPRADRLQIEPALQDVYRRSVSAFIQEPSVRTAPMDFDPGPGHIRSDLKQLLQHGRLLANHNLERSRVETWQDILPKRNNRAA